MRNIKIIILMILSIISIKSYSQNKNYGNALKQFFNYNSTDTLSSDLNIMAIIKIKTPTVEINISPDSVRYYFQHQYREDIIDILTPYFEKQLSITELYELSEISNQDNVKQAINHIDEAIADTACARRIISSIMTSAISSIFSSDSQIINIPINCPKEYYDSVAKICNSSDIDNQITNLLGPLGSGNLDNAIIMQIATSIMGKSMPNILTNIYWGHVTQNDLNTLLKVFSMPSFIHMNKAISEVIINWPNITAEVVQKMSLWAMKSK